MAGMILDMSSATNIYVDVPNDRFEDLYNALGGGWADSSNQFCTTFDTVEEAADDTNADELGRKFAKEFLKVWKAKGLPRGCDVIVQKEDPK